MGQGASPEDIRQLTRYSYTHLAACLPFVALGGFGVIPPWVFAAASMPLGAVVGRFTLRPPRAGVLAGIAGMAVAGVISGVLAALGAILDPRVLTNPRQAVALGAGAVVGCLVGWLVWDTMRGPQSGTGGTDAKASEKGERGV
ncbi:hypothetical protein [Zavarzinella formosa]|uniref:hypothetical protein n=1 Tax=Zavarzinella formosa TaxID=360055 RepID=UPI000319B038|nr:hypothetical protein [Zavarzinella formosa]